MDVPPLTTRQVALALGVSDASLKRWCDKGLIPTIRTAGGHRRLNVSGVIQYLLRSGHPLLRPDLLGLPAPSGSAAEAIQRGRRQMRRALLEGDEATFRRMGHNLIQAGVRARDLFDRAILPLVDGFHVTTDQPPIRPWQQQAALASIERWIHDLRPRHEVAPSNRPMSYGCAGPGAPSQLLSLMIDLVLRELGQPARSIGQGLSAGALADAVTALRPRIFWLALHHSPNAGEFLAGIEALAAAARASGTTLLICAPDLPHATRQDVNFVNHCATMAQVAIFAGTFSPAVGAAR